MLKHASGVASLIAAQDVRDLRIRLADLANPGRGRPQVTRGVVHPGPKKFDEQRGIGYGARRDAGRARGGAQEGRRPPHPRRLSAAVGGLDDKFVGVVTDDADLHRCSALTGVPLDLRRPRDVFGSRAAS